MFKISILDETNEELEAFVEEVTAVMEGQEMLVTPGLFNLESEDSEDHLYVDAEEESDFTRGQEPTEDAPTGVAQPEEE